MGENRHGGANAAVTFSGEYAQEPGRAQDHPAIYQKVSIAWPQLSIILTM